MDQLLKFINNLNAAQRAVVVGGFSVLFIFLIGLLVYSSFKAEGEKLNYTVATNLSKSQVMLASSELESSGIPFAIVGSGNDLTIKTSKDFINIAKIKLITSDAGSSTHSGWELFEKSSLGTTNFENKVKYLRALEGELGRSLESLSGVIRANVKIALPKETIFTQQKALPSASAVLTLRAGIYLTQNQIDGIKNFIASAVSDLTPENINLIDQDGAILEKSQSETENHLFKTQSDYRKKIEKDYEEKIISLLEPFVGVGRVVARVSVNLDYTKFESHEEIYDPEGTIRSQQVNETTSQTQGAPTQAGGVPGVQSNIQDPNNDANALAVRSSSEGTQTTTNFEISKRIVSKRDNGFGTLNRINAAVTFDSAILDENVDKDEFTNSMTKIVEDAIGYNAQRGDNVTVKDFRFIVATAGATVGADGQIIAPDGSSADTLAMIKSFMKEFGEYFQYIIAAIILFVFYKKFIASHEVVVLGNTQPVATNKPRERQGSINGGLSDDDYGFEEEFDHNSAHNRLKAKVKSQIMNNLEGLDEESAAKYEVLIEDIDKQINTKPQDIANMISLLLNEADAGGSSKGRGGR
ncbi:flagellar basal-body MS-ring/collar protein FliF [Arcobacter sp. FWKO B]|uniref:flagellar basal-body MS-ring/collar protein FliF n=1 Tax=Arcobacter sp. FWKO B TaxID=2593672 RepID=UPI0018A3430B|nr:flagellar basal-body MS-ring/collar protein FliF [Arcobacter sp. FWKO B]QOG12023.1 flagellar M-ring protein FliF [Arcobacter sp. FWKO B]